MSKKKTRGNGHEHDHGSDAEGAEVLQNCLIACPLAIDGPALEALPMEALANALTIAVDGGLEHFETLGREPDAWAGDGDSLAADVKKRTAKQKFPRMMLKSDKNYSDLEYALHFAGEALLAGQWQGDLILIGAQGGRFDHELGNVLAVERWLKDIASSAGLENCPNVYSYGDHGVWIATASRVEFEQPKGSKFSVFAFDSTTRMTVNGAKYSIKAKPFEHATHGLSNLGNGKKVTVQVAAQKSAVQPAFIVFPA